MNETTTLAAHAALVAEAARACMVACAELAAAGHPTTLPAPR